MKMKHKVNIDLLEQALKELRGYVVRPPQGQEVVFVASGGLDSTCGIAMMIEEYDCTVYPLFVRRHSTAMLYEEKAFDAVAEVYKKKYGKKFVTPEKVEVEIPPKKFKDGLSKERLSTIGHSMRNATLQNIGVQYAVHLNDSQGKNIKTVMAGSVLDDGFPHNFIEFFRLQTMLVCHDLNDIQWQVLSPFIDSYLTKIPGYKRDMIAWANEHDVPLDLTRTCTRGGELSCGECGECIPRLNAFKAAGVTDPIAYEQKK